MKLLGVFRVLRISNTEAGATASEYALMISGIALALVGATVFLGERIALAFDVVAGKLF